MATRWACVGPGQIASDFFLAIQDNLPKEEHKFVAVASRSKEKADRFAEKYHFEKSYTSYDDVATDADVDVVYISTVNCNHVELSIKMLEAGKHVLCEKPMALNSREAGRVVETSRRCGRFFMEGVWSRFFPVYDKIRTELNEGRLGEVRYVQAELSLPLMGIENIYSHKLGGGALLAIGIYTVQLATLVFNEQPESITAVGNMAKTGVDENAVVILKYKNGAIANLAYNCDAGLGPNMATIMGRNGRIDISSFCNPTHVTTPSGEFDFPLKDNAYNLPNSAGLHYEAAAVRDCINKGLIESPLYSHADCTLVHTIMDEIRRQVGLRYDVDDVKE